LTEALEESNIKALIEQLPPPSNARLLPGRVPAVKHISEQSSVEKSDIEAIHQDSDQDRHNSRISLPQIAGSTNDFKGSFGEAKTVVRLK
jgi:hypothetical protein